MMRKSLIVVPVMLAALVASVPAALAQSDCKTIVPASRGARTIRPALPTG